MGGPEHTPLTPHFCKLGSVSVYFLPTPQNRVTNSRLRQITKKNKSSGPPTHTYRARNVSRKRARRPLRTRAPVTLRSIISPKNCQHFTTLPFFFNNNILPLLLTKLDIWP